MVRLLLFAFFAFAAHSFAFDTVVIDAGHGGHDRGGIPGQRACEKTLALDVALRLKAMLREQGIRTVMTRHDDTFISLPHRVAIANTQRNALFVSIHFNSAFRRGADGTETFYYNRKAAPVAVRIQKHLAKVNGNENRGVKRRGYYVLRKTRIPAVLVECAFLTNPQEAVRCQSPTHRQQLADAIYRGIKPSLQTPGSSASAVPEPPKLPISRRAPWPGGSWLAENEGTCDDEHAAARLPGSAVWETTL